MIPDQTSLDLVKSYTFNVKVKQRQSILMTYTTYRYIFNAIL